MNLGTIVVYLEDPLLYGKMLVVGVHADGRLLCEQVHPDRDGVYGRELFDEHELKDAQRFELEPSRWEGRWDEREPA